MRVIPLAIAALTLLAAPAGADQSDQRLERLFHQLRRDLCLELLVDRLRRSDKLGLVFGAGFAVMASEGGVTCKISYNGSATLRS